MAIESFAFEGSEVKDLELQLNKWLRTHPSHAVHDFDVLAAGMKQVVVLWASPTDSVNLQANREFLAFVEGDATHLCDVQNQIFAKDRELAVVCGRCAMEGGAVVALIYATRIPSLGAV